MQNFSKEILETIKRSLEAQLKIAKLYGLTTYTKEEVEALEAVNEFLEVAV